MTIKGVDYSHHGYTGEQLVAGGYKFAARYVQNFPGSSFDKEMKAAELRSLSNAGVRVVANWEWQGDPPPPNSRATGKDHATNCKARLASLGVPSWAMVYYSLDVPAHAGDFNAYAQGWRDVYPAHQLGVYTCGSLFRQLLADGYVTRAWQSMSRSYPGNHHADGSWNHDGAHVIQTGHGTYAGHELDFDTALVADYGGFLLGEADPNAPPSEEDMPLTAADAKTILTTDVVPNFPWAADAKTNPTISLQTAILVAGNQAHAAYNAAAKGVDADALAARSEEHTSELQSQ